MIILLASFGLVRFWYSSKFSFNLGSHFFFFLSLKMCFTQYIASLLDYTDTFLLVHGTRNIM